MAELRISSEQVCFIIAKARAFDAKVAPSGLETGSNPADDQMIGVLEDRPRDPDEEELRGALESLNMTELTDVIALLRLGRDDRSIEEWPDVLREIADAPPDRPVESLVRTPLLGDHLEAGLNEFGITCTDSGEAVELSTRFKGD